MTVPWESRSAGRHAHGAGAPFRIGVLGVVNGVIEEIAGNLEAEAGGKRQEGQGRIPVSGQFLHHHAACPYRNEGGGECFGACRQKGGSNNVHERAERKAPESAENRAEVAEGFLDEGDVPLAGRRLFFPPGSRTPGRSRAGSKAGGRRAPWVPCP